MKGYFSRIARQSGLAYASKTAARALTDSGGIEDAFAPEAEHTVMVEPSFPEATFSAASGSKPRPDDTGTAALGLPGFTPAVAAQAPVRRETPVYAAGSEGLHAAAGNSNEVIHPLPRPAALESRISHVSRAIEPTTHDDSNPPEGARERTRHAGIANLMAVEESPARNAAEPVIESKQFFARTAAILGHEETVTPELQAIVLREVQEWVAAAPLEPPPAQAAPRTRATEVKVARPHAPGVVTIRESAPPPEQAQPIEQNFDLSIGTINVTIEESEKPRLPEPRTRQADQTARDDESRFSRLSRSYL